MRRIVLAVMISLVAGRFADLHVEITGPTGSYATNISTTNNTIMREESTLPPWNMNDPWLYRYHWQDPREDFKLLKQPNWLKELRQTPRRMKRPFPKNSPGPQTSHRRGAY